MATINICDICGKVISDYHQNRQFKIKELKPFFSFGLDGTSYHWETIDAHVSCINMLLKAKEINEGYGDIFNESDNRSRCS